MRAPPPRRSLFCIATLLALASPARPLAAQLPLAPATWSLFEWFLGVGPVEGSGFLLDATERMRVRVTDAGATGDAYDVFVNGVFRVGTPTVPGGTLTGAFDGAAAWAEPGLSKGEFFVDPGLYTITLAVREAGSGFDFGEGFIRADRAPVVGVVPEPATVALLAGGLLAIGLTVRRRARAAARSARRGVRV